MNYIGIKNSSCSKTGIPKRRYIHSKKPSYPLPMILLITRFPLSSSLPPFSSPTEREESIYFLVVVMSIDRTKLAKFNDWTERCRDDVTRTSFATKIMHWII